MVHTCQFFLSQITFLLLAAFSVFHLDQWYFNCFSNPLSQDSCLSEWVCFALVIFLIESCNSCFWCFETHHNLILLSLIWKKIILVLSCTSSYLFSVLFRLLNPLYLLPKLEKSLNENLRKPFFLLKCNDMKLGTEFCSWKRAKECFHWILPVMLVWGKSKKFMTFLVQWLQKKELQRKKQFLEKLSSEANFICYSGLLTFSLLLFSIEYFHNLSMLA